MIRNLKVLGLAVVAVLATSAMVAAAAQAETFQSEEGGISVRGTQTEPATFTAAGATITCQEGTFLGMGGPETSEPTLLIDDIKYGNCKFLFFNTTVNAKGCGYDFHAGEGGVGSVDVVAVTEECSERGGITFEASGCKVTVPPQEGLKNINYANNGKSGSDREVIVTPEVGGIEYDAEGFCPEPGQNQTNGAYENGAASVTGAPDTTFSSMVGVFYA